MSITLTDDVEAFQPKERLEEKYDHILEIRIDNARTRKLLSDTEEQLAEVRAEEAFAMFFSEMDGRRSDRMRDARRLILRHRRADCS